MGRQCDDDEDRLPWAGDPMTTLLAAIIRRAIRDARRDGVLAEEAQSFLVHIGLKDRIEREAPRRRRRCA